MSQWTPQQLKWLKKYLKPQVDRAWSWWPVGNEARRRAQGSTPGSQICARCKGEFTRTETQKDHIEPTVRIGENEFEDPGEYIRRKFVPFPEQIQILCKNCHKQKTVSENAERKIVKRSKLNCKIKNS